MFNTLMDSDSVQDRCFPCQTMVKPLALRAFMIIILKSFPRKATLLGKGVLPNSFFLEVVKCHYSVSFISAVVI